MPWNGGGYGGYGGYVGYVGLADAFCDELMCKLLDESSVLYFDDGHLILHGSEYVSFY